jgi:general secretion pathway protein K
MNTTASMHRPGAQRGAALLLAMLVLTLVATLASAMVWQQSRAIQVEAAERSNLQSGWILTGALDWARLILREDTRTGGADHLGEPWATPLAEARLSTFLAADRDNNADSGPEAFLSGAIVDEQSFYNLRNLVGPDGKVAPAELRALERLCDAAGLPTDTPSRLAEGLRAAWAGPADGGGRSDEAADGPLAPTRVTQLTWLGLDAATVARLEPFVTLLPVPTPVNANTATREVLLAAIDGLDLGTAERLVQARQRNPFTSVEAVQALLPEGMKTDAKRVGFRSSYFRVYGRLRLDERVLEERSLVERRGADRGLEVVVLQRERRSLRSGER